MRTWFINLRKEMNISQKQLSEITACSQQLISKIEKGGAIKITTAKQISKILNIDWKKFYED